MIYRPPNFSLSGDSVPAGSTLTITRYTGTPPSGYSYATGGRFIIRPMAAIRGPAAGHSRHRLRRPAHLNHSGTVKARYYAGGNWSPITTATFSVNAAPASAANLVISEIYYKPTPPAPGTPEYLAGYTSGNNFEYVELLNVSGGDVDLTGCVFTQGITFNFATVPVGELDPAGRRARLVVGNEGRLHHAIRERHFPRRSSGPSAAT